MSVVPCPTNIFPPVCDNPPHPVKTSPAVRVLDCAQSSRCFGQQCRVLQLALAEWLCAHWKTDARAKRIVEGMKLYLLPTMNPDGFAAKQRVTGASNTPQSCCMCCRFSCSSHQNCMLLVLDKIWQPLILTS